ncbi:hypothetical protein ACFXKW_20810 [Streptomyces sp. NPDC059193]|uniref:hypothetical protein n=1 Tax=Streptomyces sp. NPDC059193 TaxID=3346763 RepID=UPI0036B0933A
MRYFTDLTQLTPYGTDTTELTMTPAGWDAHRAAINGTGFLYCTTVTGCNATAAELITHTATATQWPICLGFHDPRTVAKSLNHHITEATETAEYMADLRDRYQGDTWTPDRDRPTYAPPC